MKKKNRSTPGFTVHEAALMERLRQHPEILERVRSILEIAQSGEGPLKTADEVEELLVEEVRRLGQATMSGWAVGAEERVSRELQRQDPTVLSRKKKR
jgi:hypothetical protein